MPMNPRIRVSREPTSPRADRRARPREREEREEYLDDPKWKASKVARIGEVHAIAPAPGSI